MSSEVFQLGAGGGGRAGGSQCSSAYIRASWTHNTQDLVQSRVPCHFHFTDMQQEAAEEI